MAGARFDEVIATKLHVAPRLPKTVVERADRNWLQPQCVYSGSRFLALNSLLQREDSLVLPFRGDRLIWPSKAVIRQNALNDCNVSGAVRWRRSVIAYSWSSVWASNQTPRYPDKASLLATSSAVPCSITRPFCSTSAWSAMRNTASMSGSSVPSAGNSERHQVARLRGGLEGACRRQANCAVTAREQNPSPTQPLQFQSTIAADERRAQFNPLANPGRPGECRALHGLWPVYLGL